MPPHVSYENSDQSPVYGMDDLMLRAKLATGLEYDPTNPHLSDWLRTIYFGDYEGFLGFLRGLSEEEVKVQVSKRESLYNRSAVFHVIEGASFESLTSSDPNFLWWHRQHFKDGHSHMKILIKLLTLGADVNV